MSADTAISWTDKTWNHIRGCSRVSEGCRNCYAETTARRMGGRGKAYEGLVETKLRVIDGEQVMVPLWTGEIRFIAEDLIVPLQWSKPTMVFVNSMSDLFHEKVTNEQIAATFGIMAAARRHTFQCLTKRAKRMLEWFAWVERKARACNDGMGMTEAAFCFVWAQRLYPHVPFNLYGSPVANPLAKADRVQNACTAPWPLPNVWIGVSTENQSTADDRIPFLIETPATVRFLSCEPLLGRIEIPHDWWSRIQWAIAGCESGQRSRPCDIEWLRSLRDQCDRFDVHFFLKQAKPHGALVTTVEDIRNLEPGETDAWNSGIHGVDIQETNAVRTRPAPKKKRWGVIERPYLDGRQHIAMPPR